MDKSQIIETRTCPMCGKEFDINCYQTRKVYCDDCRNVHYKQYRKEYAETHKDEIREYNRRHKKHRVYKKFTCKICGREFQTCRGGVPKYCTPCLEKFKYIPPYNTYYERRMDAECRENSNRCFSDAQKRK